jgi:DNA-binding transcriptional regulator GbsR (MarR family)
MRSMVDPRSQLADAPLSLPEMTELAEAMGNFIRYWGFKKIHGKIWLHLYLSDTPLDAGTLSRRLDVSKGLMSLALRDLLEHEVICGAGKSARATQLFCASSELLTVILNVLKRREKHLLAHIDVAFRLLAALPDEQKSQHRLSHARLRDLGGLIRDAQSHLEELLDLGTFDLTNWQSAPQTERRGADEEVE